MKNKNIAIVGAGFAGLASATLLARPGHRVTVYEKFAEPRSVGAGVLVQPTGLAAMRVLGIEREIIDAGGRVEHLWGVTPTGRAVIDIHYADWRRDAFGVGLHRGVLFNALWRQALAAGVEIVTGKSVDQLDVLTSAFDLTIVADGAHSQLRAQTGLTVHHRVYPWGALWAVLPDPDNLYAQRMTLLQWYRRAGQMLGIMPTGKRPEDDATVISLFWSLRADKLLAWRERGLEAWKAEVRALNPDAESLLSQIDTPEQLAWAQYADVVMPRYHTDRLVVIGDAAHATSPQLGQGTNLALLDAVTLAECIERSSAISNALDKYTRLRKSHLHFYGLMSRLLTPVFQSDQKLLPWLRDAIMATTSKWPIARDINRQVLVGVRGGWLRGEARHWLGEP
ncbi:MAG: FAD-dependent monooxygenase [Betaproteobacteria bacterium]|nr:FAD-dependent monooxygenase [Betaproteobacteria bacterium]